jgi:hypothetical protein
MNGKEASAIRWCQLGNTPKLQNDKGGDETRKVPVAKVTPHG